MRKYFLASIICLIGCYMFCGCNIVNPDEKIPYFIQIDSVKLDGANYLKYGSTQQAKITEVWVYANNDLLGGYELPANVPIIADSNATISIQAGIRVNGIGSQRRPYPFYNFYTTNITWPKATRQKITPQFTYADKAEAMQNWDFESSNPFIPRNAGADEPLQATATNSKVFEGIASGLWLVDTSLPYHEVITNDVYTLEQGKEFYMEFDYKSTCNFEVHALAKISGQFQNVLVSGVNKKDTWNKMYINLGAMVTQLGATDYQFILRSALDSTQNNGEILIDNMKIMRFN
jgi:hypothetical protein